MRGYKAMHLQRAIGVVELSLLAVLISTDGHITIDHPLVHEKSAQSGSQNSCPAKCECEKISSVGSVGNGSQTGGANRQISLAIYCYRGGLTDSDFLSLLQSIPSTVNIIEIVAPRERPNNFQLINCGIPALSQTIRLPSLIYLSLSENRIDQLQIGSFIGVPLLETLDVSLNRIDTLSTGAFLYLKKLNRLSLSHNRLGNIAAGLLNGPLALEELELDGNPLRSAKQLNDMFSDVPHLRRLEINNCQLDDAEIGDLHLIKVAELRRLGVGANNLTSVPSSTIRALAKLATIDLSTNLITKLEPCAFCSCNISRVLLAHNQLGEETIHPEAFADTRLEELDISYNSLLKFKSTMLHAAKPTVKVLHLSGNGLSAFGSELIESLPQLRHLHMASNGIREFPHMLARGYRQLTLLNLSSNGLTQLPYNIASILPRLKSLDVSHNKLASIPPEVVSSMVERLDEIFLNDNPWECECAVQPLQQYMLQRLGTRNRQSFERTLCATPALLRGQPLHRVHKINDCAIFFGSGYGLTEASELLLLLSALLVAAFLVSILVILLLYCGRERRQKALYITGETGTPCRHPFSNGDLKGGGKALSVSQSLGPESLLLANGFGSGMNGTIRNGISPLTDKNLTRTAEVQKLLIANNDHNFNSLRSPPPPPTSGSMLLTF